MIEDRGGDSHTQVSTVYHEIRSYRETHCIQWVQVSFSVSIDVYLHTRPDSIGRCVPTLVDVSVPHLCLFVSTRPVLEFRSRKNRWCRNPKRNGADGETNDHHSNYSLDSPQDRRDSVRESRGYRVDLTGREPTRSLGVWDTRRAVAPLAQFVGTRGRTGRLSRGRPTPDVRCPLGPSRSTPTDPLGLTTPIGPYLTFLGSEE